MILKYLNRILENLYKILLKTLFLRRFLNYELFENILDLQALIFNVFSAFIKQKQ